jgi:hypothetical protein
VTEIEIAGHALALSDLRLDLDRATTPAEYTAVLDKATAIESHARRHRRGLLKRDLLDLARHAYIIEVEAAFAYAEAVIRIAGRLPDRGRIGRGRPAIYSAGDFGISHDIAARWKRYRNTLGNRDLDIERAAWLEQADGDPAGWDEPSLAGIVRRARMQEESTTDSMICPRCGEVTIAVERRARRRCFGCSWPSKNTPRTFTEPTSVADRRATG